MKIITSSFRVKDEVQFHKKSNWRFFLPLAWLHRSHRHPDHVNYWTCNDVCIWSTWSNFIVTRLLLVSIGYYNLPCHNPLTYRHAMQYNGPISPFVDLDFFATLWEKIATHQMKVDGSERVTFPTRLTSPWIWKNTISGIHG